MMASAPASGITGWFRIVSVPPCGARLGLTVQFSAGHSNGALVRSIDPKLCRFADLIAVGDRIVTCDGRRVNCTDDLRKGSDGTRRFGIVPAIVSTVVGETNSNQPALPSADRLAAGGGTSTDIDNFLRGRGCLESTAATRVSAAFDEVSTATGKVIKFTVEVPPINAASTDDSATIQGAAVDGTSTTCTAKAAANNAARSPDDTTRGSKSGDHASSSFCASLKSYVTAQIGSRLDSLDDLATSSGNRAALDPERVARSRAELLEEAVRDFPFLAEVDWDAERRGHRERLERSIDAEVSRADDVVRGQTKQVVKSSCKEDMHSESDDTRNSSEASDASNVGFGDDNADEIEADQDACSGDLSETELSKVDHNFAGLPSTTCPAVAHDAPDLADDAKSIPNGETDADSMNVYDKRHATEEGTNGWMARAAGGTSASASVGERGAASVSAAIFPDDKRKSTASATGGSMAGATKRAEPSASSAAPSENTASVTSNKRKRDSIQPKEASLTKSAESTRRARRTLESKCSHSPKPVVDDTPDSDESYSIFASDGGSGGDSDAPYDGSDSDDHGAQKPKTSAKKKAGAEESNPRKMKTYSFEQRLQQCQEYKEENGHLGIPSERYYQPNGNNLGVWADMMRRNYQDYFDGAFEPSNRVGSRCNKQTIECRLMKLEEMGFEFEQEEGGASSTNASTSSATEQGPSSASSSRVWECKIEQCRQFKAENGHLNVQSKDKTLGRFAEEMRRLYRRRLQGGTRKKSSSSAPQLTQLERERLQLLESMGFAFDGVFDVNLQKLEAFKAEKGHTKVPVRYAPDTALGHWAEMLRREHNRTRRGEASDYLTADRMRKLATVGFSFSTKKETPWEVYFEQLCAYRAEHGKDPLQSHPELGEWVQRQRFYYGHQRKEGKVKKFKLKEETWNEREEKLRGIGFVFQPLARMSAEAKARAKEGRKKSWEDRLADFVAWKDRHGHPYVPQNGQGEEKHLGRWVAKQRMAYRVYKGENKSKKYGKLTADQALKLANAGFAFDASNIRRTPKDKVAASAEAEEEEPRVEQQHALEGYECHLTRETAEMQWGTY